MKKRIDFFTRTTASTMALFTAVSLFACSNTANDTTDASSDQPTEDAAVTTSAIEDTDVATDTAEITTITENADTEGTNAPAEDTTAPTEDTKAPETLPAETKAPETKPQITTAPPAPVPEKVYASKEEYPDDWGEKNAILRFKGNTFFWEETRVMHTIPTGVPEVEDWLIILPDAENDQIVFFADGKDNSIECYSMVDGVFYKLNEGRVIMQWQDGSGPYYFIEEDGTAKSVNVRSKKYNEVYIEAEGVRSYIHSRQSFVTTDGTKLIAPNSKNILAEVKVIG